MVGFCRKMTWRARAAHARNELDLYTGGNVKQMFGKIIGKLGNVFKIMI